MQKYAIISPHLDDGVLSCGDYIKKLIDEGNVVTIISVFTGYPLSNQLSRAAKQYHANCFLSDDSMEYRKKEDIQACNILGCQYIHLNYYECLYRKDKYGNNIYPDLNDIYHLDDDSEILYFKQLIDEFSRLLDEFDCVLAPLGLGNHADHLLINKVIKTIDKTKKCQILYYEEIPYICYMSSNKKIIIPEMKPIVVKLSETHWEFKVRAILCYRSQLHIMWKDEYERLKQLKGATSMYGFNNAIRFWEMEERVNDCKL